VPFVPYRELIAQVERRSSALGYFEAWDIPSLIGVIRAAEDSASPVMVGFNGAYLPEVCRREIRFLRSYGQAAREAAEAAKVPVALLFNESPYLEWVYAAMESGFNAVMYTDERIAWQERVKRITGIVKKAHASGIAVEAELGELPESPQSSDGGRSFLTDPAEAERFIHETGVDAIGVWVGNRHSPGAERTTLDIGLIAELRRRLTVPLVLHAGSNVADVSLREGVRAGIRRINYGRAIKEPAFHSIAARAGSPGAVYPGFASLGSSAGVDLLGGVDGAALAKLAVLQGGAA